jgi:hypothetical protein
VTVDSSGNVGIGTTSTGAKLDIAGNLTLGSLNSTDKLLSKITFRQFVANATAYTNDGTAKLNYYADPSNNYFRSLDIVSSSYNTRSQIKFFTSSDSSNVNEKMRINSDGNVGIGVLSPAAKLEVNGTKLLHVLIGDPGCGNGFAGIGFGSLSGCTNYRIIGDSQSTYINRLSGGLIYFRENNANQMTIASGGNVGIGTASPAAKLDVNGNIVLSGVVIRNPTASFSTTISNPAITTNRTLNLPLINGTDTLASLGKVQTFTANQTFTQAPTFSSGIHTGGNIASTASSGTFKITAPAGVAICIGTGC